MAQMRLNSDGERETLKPADWLALRERLRAVRRAGAGQDTPGGSLRGAGIFPLACDRFPIYPARVNSTQHHRWPC